MEKLNKCDLIEFVSSDARLSLTDAKAAVDVVFDKIEEALLSGKEVNVSRFGTFTVKARKQRIGTNPKTHEKITIKSRNTIFFNPSGNLKEKL